MKIADIVVKHISESDYDGLHAGDYGVVDDIYYDCKKLGLIKSDKNNHPANHKIPIFAALERDKRFEKQYIRCMNSTGRERRLRYFKYNKESDE